MSKRIRPHAGVKIKDLTECNTVLFKLAHYRAKLQEEEDGYKRAVNTYKEITQRRMEPIVEEIKKYEGWLAQYAKAHPEHFEKKKTVELIFGMFGFRKTTKISVTQKTLGLLKHLGFETGIRIKESVDKEALRGFTDAQLDQVKAKRVEKDEFWYELNDDAISEKAKRAAS